MEITRLTPISYCFGVTKAIDKALEIKYKFPDKNIYFFGELVHNENVIKYFNSLNIKAVPFTEFNALEILEQFTTDDVVIFSAHGHDKKYEEVLNKNNVTFFDTTCIKVKKVLDQISTYDGEIIYVGKTGHPETIASLSYSKKIYLYDIAKDFKFNYSQVKTNTPLILNQSTLSILEIKNIFDDIKIHYKNAVFIDEICSASRIRQEKILQLDSSVDLVVVVGDKKSSNSTKLYNLSNDNNKNVLTIMVNSVNDLSKYNLKHYKKALIASGTSTPLETIKEIESYLEEQN